MGVPVISSDVGGQKELINEEVGKIVPCMQKETDIYNFKYDENEIKLFVDAIEEIISNLNYYKNNCRNRILKQFTLDQMSKEMTSVFETYINNPSKEKIENGEGLSRVIGITKELICANNISEVQKTKYLVSTYYNKVYGIMLCGENS